MIFPWAEILISSFVATFIIFAYYILRSYKNGFYYCTKWFLIGLFISFFCSYIITSILQSTTNEVVIVQDYGKYKKYEIWGDISIVEDGDTIADLKGLTTFADYVYNKSNYKLILYPVQYSHDGNSKTNEEPIIIDEGQIVFTKELPEFYFSLPPDSIEVERSNFIVVRLIEDIFGSNDTKWVLDRSIYGTPYSSSLGKAMDIMMSPHSTLSDQLGISGMGKIIPEKKQISSLPIEIEKKIRISGDAYVTKIKNNANFIVRITLEANNKQYKAELNPGQVVEPNFVCFRIWCHTPRGNELYWEK